MPRPLALAVFLTLLGAASPALAEAEACRRGAWLDPASGRALAHDAVLARAAAHPFVLLGETHDDPEHHRWQLSTLAGLLALQPSLALGFEAFPVRVQPVLDRWVAGELGEAAFLAEVEWRRIWNLDPELYLPLFRFARMHRLPMVALNTERALVARVGREGWDAIPSAEREGIGDPAPPGAAYLDRLQGFFGQHGSATGPDDPGFRRFVDAQLTWDRAMAEALARASRERGVRLVAGIIGSEHLRHRQGVPHQLAALGLPDAAVLLPHDVARGCVGLQAGEADAVFLLDAAPVLERPRLGVRLAAGENGVRAVEVVAGSVAEASGLRAGDVILEAAGVAVAAPGELTQIVRAVAPGTWLPLKVRRDGRTLETVARFPPRPGSGP